MFWYKVKAFFRRRCTKVARRRAVVSASLPKTVIVHMGGREVVVKSLPVGKYIDYVCGLKNIPQLVSFYVRQGNQYDIGNFLIAAIAEVRGEVLDLIEKASGLPAEFIEKEVSMAEMIRFIRALLEVNEFDYVAGELRATIVKTMAAMRTLMQEMQATMEPLPADENV